MNFDLNENQLMITQMVRDFALKEIRPNMKKWDDEEYFPVETMKKLGELGLLGIFIPEKYGGSGFSYFEYATALIELGKVCGGIGLSVAAHNSLCVGHIYYHGSEEQKLKYLPKLATGEMMGCFGLTEPDYGSNPGGMITNFKDAGDHVILNGAKMWISNAPFAQIAVVWAKDESGRIHGLIVERGMEGFSTPEMHGKLSLRASATGELIFDNVKVPKSNILPGRSGLGAPLSCLDSARFGIAWGALGAAMDCYDQALRYSKERTQFDVPIGSFQLIQKKLADMQTEITLGLQGCLRVGRLMDEGKSVPEMISLIKRNSCGKALDVARMARDMHGGNGIHDEYHVIRHMINLETVNTYEGTHDVHALILGRAQTGLQAFY